MLLVASAFMSPPLIVAFCCQELLLLLLPLADTSHFGPCQLLLQLRLLPLCHQQHLLLMFFLPVE